MADKKTDYWLAAGIIVKVVNKKMLDGKYYKARYLPLRTVTA